MRAAPSKRRFVLSLLLLSTVVALPRCSSNVVNAQQQSAGKVTGHGAHLSVVGPVEAKDGVVHRRDDAQYEYEVVLTSAPVGSRLTLECQWLDPNGLIFNSNRYETRKITHDEWPTHCRSKILPNAPTGMWTVTMSHEGRRIGQMQFEVR